VFRIRVLGLGFRVQGVGCTVCLKAQRVVDEIWVAVEHGVVCVRRRVRFWPPYPGGGAPSRGAGVGVLGFKVQASGYKM
jgi:hypothetical protein